MLTSGLRYRRERGLRRSPSRNGAPVGAGAHLIIAEITQGVSVEPGHPCALYLNLGSLAYLASLGYEPIVSASVHHPPGTRPFPCRSPTFALLIGYRVTFQAAILDPSGIPLVKTPVALSRPTALGIEQPPTGGLNDPSPGLDSEAIVRRAGARSPRARRGPTPRSAIALPPRARRASSRTRRTALITVC